jgi:hypothetical protein
MEGDYHRFSLITYIVHPCCPVLDYERNLQFRFLVFFYWVGENLWYNNSSENEFLDLENLRSGSKSGFRKNLNLQSRYPRT